MANHIITLNQIIELFEQFADNHPQLQSFGFGPTSDIGTSVKMQYPAMWTTFETDSSMMVQNRNISPELNFTMLFMDKINIQPNVKDANGFDSDNQREILSDTLQMAQDLLSEMVSYWGQYGIGVTDNVSTFPLVDETDDKVNGWGLRFSLRLKHFNCATEIGDIRIEKPTEINYLTCDTLPDCQAFIDIEQRITDLELGGGGGGLTCATIGNCQVIQDMQTDINTNTNDIVLINDDIIEIKDDIIELKALTGGTTTFDCDMLTGCTIITDIQQDISTNTSDIGGIQDDINYISGETTTNTSNINTNTGDISNLDGRVGDNEQDIAELKALTGDTTPFDCDQLSGCTIIQDIQQDINTIEGDISTAQDDINFISGATSSNTSDIGQLQSDVASKIGCDDLATCQEIIDINTDIQTNTGNISTNTGNISGLQGAVGDIEDDINFISGATSSNTSDISQLQSDIVNKLECSDLDNCQTIINIKSDISAISGSTGGGFTGNTSGNCITELYVENIYGCAGVTIHSSVQHNSSTASGQLSTAFGRDTEASGMYSHTQGQNTTANAPFSHAQGHGTTASGHQSHAQGLDSVASGNNSHAQGYDTTASGQGSHAEGFMTIASGNHSHAQGNSTTASGNQSHAGGYGASDTSRVIAGGQASFAHFTNFTYTPIGAMAYASAILGGGNHNIEENAIRSAILGGLNNNIVNGATDSVILGGSNITATEDNTVYVPKLVATDIPAFADEAAAVAGGLETGAFYQTDGTGAAPLNVAGILMIKQ